MNRTVSNEVLVDELEGAKRLETAGQHVPTGDSRKNSSAFPHAVEANPGPASADWSHSNGKRVLDVTVASSALVVFAPLMAVTALAVKLSSKGPILFRQKRMGAHGKTFTIYKFRTMRADLREPGPSVTKAGDKRMTGIGAFLRRSKLDELPQLLNVVRGDMSLVGPRPKVPHHQRWTLRYRPGITGAASLAFRNEEQVLQSIPEAHLDDYQVHVLMPMKTKLDDQYMREASLASDLKLMMRTVFGTSKQVMNVGVHRTQHSLVLLNSALQKANTPHGNQMPEKIAS